LDVSMLGKGIYIIKVQDDFMIRTSKLLKQ
jgi:hypothetical protein